MEVDIAYLQDKLEEQYFLTSVETGDDAGCTFSKQVEVVGELIAGLDSYPISMAMHCDIANTTDKVITGAVDVTDILQSDSASVTGYFGGTSAGKYLLIGAPIVSEGQKLKYDSLATVEPANVVGQAYISDLAGWQTAPRMGTNAVAPFNSNAWNFAKHNNEQIFYGFDPLTRDLPDQWEINTFNINGTDYTMYFSRVLILSPITGDPQAQQIKLHTNRVEIETEGIFKYARARSPIELNLDVKESTTAPKDGTFVLTSNSSVKGKKNRFENGNTDKVVYAIERTWNLDTSVPLVLEIGYIINGPQTGTLEFTIEISQVKDGFVFDGSEPFSTDIATIPFLTPADKVQQTLDFLIPVQELENNSTVFVTLTRASGAGNDDLLQDVIVTLERAFGYSWKV